MTSPLRHFVDGEALRDYLRCPQEYAYRWHYQIPERPQTTRQFFQRAVRRTALSIARETLAGKTVTADQGLLLWQLGTHDTPIATHPSINTAGRDIVGRFLRWLETVKVLGLAVTRQITLTFGHRRFCDVELTSDLYLTLRGKERLVLLTPPDPGIVATLAGCDTVPWAELSLLSCTTRLIPRTSSDVQEGLSGVVEQAFRGLSRGIVWPNRDSRCRGCPFSDVCTPGDARRYLMQSETKRARVRARVAKVRARYDGPQNPTAPGRPSE